MKKKTVIMKVWLVLCHTIKKICYYAVQLNRLVYVTTYVSICSRPINKFVRCLFNAKQNVYFDFTLVGTWKEIIGTYDNKIKQSYKKWIIVKGFWTFIANEDKTLRKQRGLWRLFFFITRLLGGEFGTGLINCVIVSHAISCDFYSQELYSSNEDCVFFRVLREAVKS